MVPALVDRLEQDERRLNSRESRVRELCPALLVIRFNGRLIFRECQFGTNERVHVAVGNMMRDLPHRPSARTIRRIKLLRRESAQSLAHSGRNLLDCVDRRFALLLSERTCISEFADWIAEILDWSGCAHRILLGLMLELATFENLTASIGPAFTV